MAQMTDDLNFELACKTAQEGYKECGSGRPTLLAFKEGVAIAVCDLTDVMDHGAKAAAAVSHAMKSQGCDMYIFISEAWSAKMTSDDMINPETPKVWPRHRSDRVEVLFIQQEANGFSRSRAYAVSKGEVLGVWEDLDSRTIPDMEHGGIWSGLLK